MGRVKNHPKKCGTSPCRRPEEADELEDNDHNFFADICASKTPVLSARKQSREAADIAACVSAHGQAPVRYSATEAADLPKAREEAKSKIAQRVLQEALRQGDRKAQRIATGERSKSSASLSAKKRTSARRKNPSYNTV